MKQYAYIVLSVMVMIMAGCGAQKRMTSTSGQASVAEETPIVPAWRTCLIQSARATVQNNEQRITANITMQVVRDSLLVISVMPLFGIEVMRIEATPSELIGIDKLHGQYAVTTYDELNRKLSPSLTWDILQDICSGELPSGSDKTQLYYTFGDDIIQLDIVYTPRRTDIPLNVTHQRTDRYTRIDISKWL